MLNNPVNQSHRFRSKFQLLISYAILVMLSTAFILSDWIYGYFTFSEYILFLVLLILIGTLNFKLSKEQLILITVFLSYLTAHTILQYIFNEEFVLQTALLGIAKLLFYSVCLSVSYNYIKEKQLDYSFLLINNVIAVVVIIVGFYITFELYRESTIPQEFFWRFTRRDIYSYYFESNPAIIRTRSMFSEPAHLGFYLNTLVAVNLFSLIKSNAIFLLTILLVIGILSTFSYSMIAILLFIVGLKIFILFRSKSFKWSNWLLLIPLTLVLFSIVYWDTIEATLIQRTLSVFTGQDISARMRLFDSWQYIDSSNFILGNGLGQTPIVTNIYAYALSDFGITGFLVLLGISAFLVKKKWTLGIVFILLNSAKGGYLSSGYWLMILLILLYSMEKNDRMYLKQNYWN